MLYEVITDKAAREGSGEAVGTEEGARSSNSGALSFGSEFEMRRMVTGRRRGGSDESVARQGWRVVYV